MGKKITRDQEDEYFRLRARGHSIRESANRAGFSMGTGQKFEKQGWQAEEISPEEREARLSGPKAYKDLCAEAKRALEDFPYFQRRYFGRVAIPWQSIAAQKIVEYLATPDEEYVVINAPPGAGKTFMFHDLACWLICRDRQIRGLYGSVTSPLAERMNNRLRRTLDRTIPEKATTADLAAGLAFDALATLAQDFGRFHPEGREQWSANAFVVEQTGGQAITQKEATWSSYGMNEGFIGGRFNIVFWDDLVDPKKLRSPESREQLEDMWTDVAENRLEPGGCLALIGQRISSTDLYRFCLDMKTPEHLDPETGETVPEAPKYHHLLYKAHYEELCSEDSHKAGAKAWPDGCLINPRRLSWKKIQTLKANRGDRFEVLYQQQDVDPEAQLVQHDWIWGNNGHIGCIDRDRGNCEFYKGLTGEIFSVVSVDPSPTKYWGLHWVIYHPDSEQRFIMESLRTKMASDEFIDFDYNTQKHTGLMTQWQERSVDLGFPITHWIVEINAAQRFLLPYNHVQRFIQKYSIELIPHETMRNKADPEYGVQSIAQHFKYGRVRIPFKNGDDSVVSSRRFIDELTHYPEGVTDQVMAYWFFEWQLPNRFTPHVEESFQSRPSFTQGLPWLR